MSNICTNTITAIGVQEEPTAFVKVLSKVMFEIDLDNPNLDWWGLKDKGIDPKSWYKTLTDEYRNEGSYAARFAILYVKEPYSKLGVTAPRFYVETKVAPPFKQIVKASQVFPELTFHVDWWILQEGPAGEFVMQDGRVLEEIKRKGSWHLFDSSLLYPRISLLPAHLPFTLAQQGALRVADAIRAIEELRQILDDKAFTESPCQAYRDPSKLEQSRQTLDSLLEEMRGASKQLTFEGVFITDPRCVTFYDFEEKSPVGPVGDYERRADQALAAENAPKSAQE